MKFDAGKAATHQALVLTGDDPDARAKALSAVLEASGIDDLDVEQTVGDAMGPNDWLATVSTAPFLSERRALIVRSVGRCDPKRTLGDGKPGPAHPWVKAAGALPPTSLLVLVVDDETGDQDRQRRTKANGDAWARLVKAAGGGVYDLTVDAAAVPGLVRERAQASGKQISPVAAKLLAEMVSGRATLALAETDKLCLYVGDEPQITERDVRALVSPEQDYNVFQLADAVLGGDAGGAMRQLRTLSARTARIDEAIIVQILPRLTANVRMVWQARYLIDERADLADPPDRVRPWLPDRSIADEPDWKRRRFVAMAQRASLDQLRGCLTELVDLEARLKGARPLTTPLDALEQALLRMCGLTGPGVARTGGR